MASLQHCMASLENPHTGFLSLQGPMDHTPLILGRRPQGFTALCCTELLLLYGERHFRLHQCSTAPLQHHSK